MYITSTVHLSVWVGVMFDEGVFWSSCCAPIHFRHCTMMACTSGSGHSRIWAPNGASGLRSVAGVVGRNGRLMRGILVGGATVSGISHRRCGSSDI